MVLRVFLYLKKSDLISSFLVLIGAVEMCMTFENTRVERDFKNIGNRMLNRLLNWLIKILMILLKRAEF